MIRAHTVMATSALDGRRRFIVDSGAAVDVVKLDDLTTKEYSSAIPLQPNSFTFTTANSEAPAHSVVELELDALRGRKSRAFAMPDSPNLISLGRLCQIDGYSFHWPPYSNRPVLRSPRGVDIPLEVENFAPMLGLLTKDPRIREGSWKRIPPPLVERPVSDCADTMKDESSEEEASIHQETSEEESSDVPLATMHRGPSCADNTTVGGANRVRSSHKHDRLGLSNWLKQATGFMAHVAHAPALPTIRGSRADRRLAASEHKAKCKKFVQQVTECPCALPAVTDNALPADHDFTHFPKCARCPACVRAKLTSKAHFKTTADERIEKELRSVKQFGGLM